MSPIIIDITTTLEDILAPYRLSLDKLLVVMNRMRIACIRGLEAEKDTYHYAPLKMLPTYLSNVPDGTEAGCFYAIDVGGTNLRFLEISVINGTLVPKSTNYTIPRKIMTGKGVDLFEYIADCIYKGFENAGILGKPLDFLGFTFSFPVNQMAIDSGILIRWTKGFNASDVEGHDVVQLLREACQCKGLDIQNFILINDTSGTLLNGAFEKNSCKVGVINGTGTNACYLEETAHVRRWTGPASVRRVIINMEWGAFGEHEELDDFHTSIDDEIDVLSINPGRQIFEKMVSGMYIGEIARLLMIKASEFGLLFKGKVPIGLTKYDSFPAPMISLSYNEEAFIQNFESSFGYPLDSLEYRAIATICDVVSRRSAGLCASGLVAILKRISCSDGVIAADGSIFKLHPYYMSYVNEFMKEMISEKRNFEIILVDDGSGKGAALAACVASVEQRKAQTG
uniref:Phosphotransferase n=1 Tax=Myxobolus squamalis TaxID=59785 RepID=A0A6B2G307_MYXSQ